MKERIEEIMRAKGVNSTQFAEMTDIKQASLSHILNGRNKPSLDVVMKIHQAFPAISLDWLLYGNGGMTIDGANLETDEHLQPATDVSAEKAGVFQAGMPLFGSAGGQEPEETEQPPAQTIVKEKIQYIEKPPRKVVEVRIFFDDGTYETLAPFK